MCISPYLKNTAISAKINIIQRIKNKYKYSVKRSIFMIY